MTATKSEGTAADAHALGVIEGTPRPLSVVIGLEGLALGGCPINALDLGRALRERGHQVNVFAVDEDVRVSLIPYARQSGFDVELLPTRAGTAARARQIRRFAGQHDADVVHVFAPWLGSAAAIAMGSRRRGIAVVTNWMMNNVRYVPRRTPMVVGTRSMQQDAQEWHAGRVWLMEPPVDVSGELAGRDGARAFRTEHGVGDEDIAAVIVGRVDSHMKAEGIRNAIGAVAALDSPNLRLILVGDGNAFDEIQREAEGVNKQLGRSAVIMTGAIYDPRPAYAAADITLAMGGSALRSLTHGKPLIVLGENGFARQFGPDTVDYFVQYGYYGNEIIDRPVDLLRSILAQLLDAGRRAELGEFGREFVQSRFALDLTAERLDGIYRRELSEVGDWTQRSFDVAQMLGRALAHQASRRLRHNIVTLRAPRRSANTNSWAKGA